MIKAIVTVVGKDRVGIIAAVSAQLAEQNINVLDITQNVLDDYFNMIMMVDITNSKLPIRDIQTGMKALGEKLGLHIRVQHEDIFNAMHNVEAEL